jgi:glutathione S-transferase
VTLALYATPLSANGRKVLAVAHQLGLAPEIHLVDVYRGEGRSSEFLAINPSGKIPVLMDGDFTLTESNAILQYLCEAHGECRLWSRDARARAAIARWLFWEVAHWQPALIALLAAFVGHALLPDVVPAPLAAPAWGSETLAPLLAQLEAQLASHPFLGGAELTIADFSVAGMMTYFRAAQFPFAAWRNLGEWYARIESLPAWRATETELWRVAARVTMNVDVRLTAMTSSHCSSFITMKRLSLVRPALLTRMSTRPSLATALSMSLVTCSLFARSHGTICTRSPSSAAKASSLSTWRPEIATSAPALWKARAMPAPMPPVAPVTRAFLPVRSNMLRYSFGEIANDYAS